MQPEQASEMPTVPTGTVKDVARLLGISRRNTYRLVESKHIPSYRVGAQLRFDLDEVAATIRATRTPE